MLIARLKPNIETLEDPQCQGVNSLTDQTSVVLTEEYDSRLLDNAIAATQQVEKIISRAKQYRQLGSSNRWLHMCRHDRLSLTAELCLHRRQLRERILATLRNKHNRRGFNLC